VAADESAYFRWHLELAAERGCGPLPDRAAPCGDCAVVHGLYSEITEALAREPADVQEAVSCRWFCHQTPNRACRGNRDLLAKLKGETTMETTTEPVKTETPKTTTVTVEVLAVGTTVWWLDRGGVGECKVTCPLCQGDTFILGHGRKFKCPQCRGSGTVTVDGLLILKGTIESATITVNPSDGSGEHIAYVVVYGRHNEYVGSDEVHTTWESANAELARINGENRAPEPFVAAVPE
jgi:hypothetical protein